MLATRPSLDTNEGHEFNSYLPHELELDGFNVVPDVDGSLEGFCIDTCAVGVGRRHRARRRRDDQLRSNPL